MWDYHDPNYLMGPYLRKQLKPHLAVKLNPVVQLLSQIDRNRKTKLKGKIKAITNFPSRIEMN